MRKRRLVLALALVAILILTVRFFFLNARLKLPVGQGIPMVSLGESHGLILATDGSLWTWGADFLGWPVLGLGNVNEQTRLQRIGSDHDWVSISASTEHNVAIKADGSLWAWGQNLEGQLGDGTVTTRNTPVRSITGNDWKQAAAGGCHTVALKKDGTIWSWGMDWAGQLGIGSTTGSMTARQVGSATNWMKVWAAGLETVALKSDGSLWYCGENLNPAFPQGSNSVQVLTRVSPDTNWVDVGFGNNTIFAIKVDGTLWAWGRNAHAYTGVQDQALDVTPMRVGTDNDWRGVPACGDWWCTGLTKKDGSLWLMDASESKPNGPSGPYPTVQFRRVELQKDVVAYVAGAVHARAPGHHEPIGVALTRDGEVWTWGMALGDPVTPGESVKTFGKKLAKRFNSKIDLGNITPIMHKKPWQLRNVEPDAPKTKVNK
ncbi:MAG: Alpha-tubulin suppressor and related protein-like protein [Pedosphaera sp.]|nr:Alpha-tubulin suppressor and related protein-like protein [Pedosphaera sp.]